MANPGLSFKKVASKPTSGMIAGEIYFVTGDKTIYVATSATTLAPFYGGEVKNVEYLAKKGETEKTQLKFTMMDGTSWTMDFSDCASATEVTNALNSLNIAYSTTGTVTQPVYDSKKTTYLNGNVAFGTTTGASYVTVTETSDANLKLIRASSDGNTVKVNGINTPADSAEGDTYPNYAANKGYVDNIKCEYNSTDKKIYLKNYTDSDTPKLLSTIDCADFIKDGILDGTALITATATSQKVTINKIEYTVTGLIVGRTYIVFAWNASAGKSVQALDVTSLIDVYTAGNGISISDDNKISVKSNSTLKFDTDGTLQVAKTPGALGIILPNGTTSYDGSATKSVTITPNSIGAATAASLNTLATQVSNLNITGDNTSSYKLGTLFSGYAGWTNLEKDKYITVSGDTDKGTITLQHRTDTADSSIILKGIATPTDNTDAANKAYVDSKVSSAISSALTWAAWS